jgi:hypothetical protein
MRRLGRGRGRKRQAHPAEVGAAIVLFLGAALGLPAADTRADTQATTQR